MKSKLAAALLALFLGGFGAHKFYLRQTGWGLAYLLLCWTLVPGLVALVEFFLLLLMSQATFDRRFNAHLLPGGAGLDEGTRLRNLQELLRSGALSEAEYELQRRKLLAG